MDSVPAGVLRGDVLVPTDELRQRAARAATALSSLGVGRSDTVAPPLRDDVPFVVASLAASTMFVRLLRLGDDEKARDDLSLLQHVVHAVGRTAEHCVVTVLDDGAEPPTGASELERQRLFTCGGLGYLDGDDYLYLGDRKRDMVISGGVNIHPAEIEACLIQLAGVQDCAVFGAGTRPRPRARPRGRPRPRCRPPRP